MAFLSCEEMLAAARSQKITLAEAVLRSDLEESRLTEAHSRAAMRHLWQVMQATSQEYDPTQRSRSGLSGGDAAKVEQAWQQGRLLGDDYLAAVTAEALKTAECNACMKRIVAAPTAGSSVPRQNGKSLLIQARSEAGMLMYNEQVIYTAHLQKTATETFEEMRDFFEGPKLRRYVAEIKTAIGREQKIGRAHV